MHPLEDTLIHHLTRLRDRSGLAGVKAEFEAEGARLEEIWRLQGLARRVGLGLTLKLGGCEARRDLREARDLGAERIVAPMVETPYALTKYLGAIRDMLGDDPAIACSVNIETRTAVANLETMLTLPGITRLDGILVGRADLAGSLGRSRHELDDPAVGALCHEAVRTARSRGLRTAIGGGMAPQAWSFLTTFKPGELDRIETRKLVFDASMLMASGPEALEEAIRFEIAWLEVKQAHHRGAAEEDLARMALLRERLQATRRVR
jgi:hypothetical protein